MIALKVIEVPLDAAARLRDAGRGPRMAEQLERSVASFAADYGVEVELPRAARACDLERRRAARRARRMRD